MENTKVKEVVVVVVEQRELGHDIQRIKKLYNKYSCAKNQRVNSTNHSSKRSAGQRFVRHLNVLDIEELDQDDMEGPQVRWNLSRFCERNDGVCKDYKAIM